MEQLTGIAVTSVASAKEMAHLLFEIGHGAVLVRGGHFEEEREAVIDAIRHLSVGEGHSRPTTLRTVSSGGMSETPNVNVYG